MNESAIECPVCLQFCVHPVQLPCKHIFCYLCVKGVANQSKRCALCRQEIPVDFLNNPELVLKKDLNESLEFEGGNQWYYEGRNGWWQYDIRTSTELEDRHAKGDKKFELLIAGFLYVIDLESMVQYRRNDHTRRRRMKRDSAHIPKKGVAGIKLEAPPRESAEGEEKESDVTAPATARVKPAGSNPDSGNVTSATSSSQSPLDSSVSSVGDSLDESLEQEFDQMSISSVRGLRRRYQAPHGQAANLALNVPQQSSESSEEEWDT